MRKLQFSCQFMDDRTLVLIWTEDSQIFRAEIPNGSLSGIDEALLNKAIGKLIPDNHLFPPWSDGITEFQQPLSPDVYVKKHYGALSTYSGTPYVTELVKAEVKALELISKNPHPNINKYLGCIRNGDLIGGICLEKCVCTLYDLVQREVPADRAPPFRPDTIIIPGIKAAIDHIHSLGLVHDDINPSNIMLDVAGNPILIDFDTCVTVGSPSRGGTPGWSTNPDLAAFENDAHGFELVTKFIRGTYQGQDHSAFEKDVDAATDK